VIERIRYVNNVVPSDYTIASLVDALASTDGVERHTAREQLEETGRPAVPFLLRALQSPSEHARWEAAKALGKITDPSAAPALVRTLEDEKAAVRWLRANAERYNLDPNHFGAWGASAGGHLVALLGTAGDVKEFDKGENLHVSSRVQAVCDYFGPTDFTRMSQFPTRMDHDAADSPESKLIGGPIQQNHDKCQRANPITYLTKDDPPFLIVHGDKDPLVPHNQSQILFEPLKKVGVNVKFHTVEGGGHGGFRDPTVEKMVERFFDEHLK